MSSGVKNGGSEPVVHYDNMQGIHASIAEVSAWRRQIHDEQEAQKGPLQVNTMPGRQATPAAEGQLQVVLSSSRGASGDRSL